MFRFLKWKKDTSSHGAGTGSGLPKECPAPQKPVDGGKRYFFTGSAVSDVGSVRSNNEDNYILGQYMNQNTSDHSEASLSISNTLGTWQIAGVFDGMGGGEMGELASHAAAEVFRNLFRQMAGGPSKADVDLLIRSAFLEANNRIVALQKAFRVFGTTGTVMCANGLDFKLYHLGDSRAYLIRENALLQLTKDQTLAQMKLEAGMYNRDALGAEADKHKLTEYIGRDWTKENLKPVESAWIPIESGDCILLCSDGLYDMCTNEEIAEILRGKRSVPEKSTQLVQAAVSHGGDDNVTCVVAAFTE